MDLNNLIIWVSLWLVLWFILWFMSWTFMKCKYDFKMEKVLWLILFMVWLWMHVYWFYFAIDVPIVFDVVWAGSAGMMLWLKANDKFTENIINKIRNNEK